MKLRLEGGKENRNTAGNTLRKTEHINKESKYNQIEIQN